MGQKVWPTDRCIIKHVMLSNGCAEITFLMSSDEGPWILQEALEVMHHIFQFHVMDAMVC